MLNVFELVTQEDRPDGRVGFVVNPDALYRAAIEHIRQRLDLQARPGGYLGQLFDMVQELPDVAFEWALRPLSDDFTPEEREMRAAVLELARKWFTEVLHQAIGQEPMGLHILKDERYRL